MNNGEIKQINEIDLALDLSKGIPYPILAKKYGRTVEQICRISLGKSRPKVREMVKEFKEVYMESLRSKLDDMGAKLVDEAYKLATEGKEDSKTKLRAIELLLDRIISKSTSKIDVTSGGESLIKYIKGIDEKDV